MSRLESLDTADLSKVFAEMSTGGDDAEMNAAARDALHGLAVVYLRHRNADRALVLALLALHLAEPTKALLHASALIMLKVGLPEQAVAALDRLDTEFGASRESGILRARAVTRLDGLTAGREVMREALTRPLSTTPAASPLEESA